MGRFITRRLVQAIPTLFGVLVLTFLLTRLSPADPVQLMLGGQYDISPEDRERLRQSLGLNDPLPIQFVTWLWHVIQFDFGNSFYYHRPVIEMIGERIPNSLQISISALLITVAVGVPLGVLAALRRGGIVDHAIRIFSVSGHAIPTFWFGLIFVLVLGVQLRWFPIGSMNVVGTDCTLCWDRIWHLIGPVAVISIGGIANLPRILRTEVLEVISQDYVRTARSKGLKERVVISAHVLRNAGAIVTDDVRRSLEASRGIGTEHVVVIGHTDCGLGPGETERVRQAVRELRTAVPGDVQGYVLDVETTTLREVE